MMLEFCVCARPSECERVLVCFNYILSKKKPIYNSLMFGLFPEDENSTRQTGRVTYDFQSPGSFYTRIGEWASPKGNHWEGISYSIFHGKIVWQGEDVRHLWFRQLLRQLQRKNNCSLSLIFCNSKLPSHSTKWAKGGTIFVVKYHNLILTAR